MNASLFYYKGFTMRDPERYPSLCRWFDALEKRHDIYTGMQSDFATHVHDLPPQMGGCYSSGSPQALANQRLVDEGPYLPVPSVVCGYPEPPDARDEALDAVLRHREAIIRVNPRPDVAEEALQCALTRLMRPGEAGPPRPPAGSDEALRYIRDRISVPRDMGIWAAAHLKTALEERDE